MPVLRHAYLIMAHADFALLRTLVSALDDADHDIYVHIDRKVKELPELHAGHAALEVFQEVDVRWGDLSVVEAEYALFGRALQHGGYAYYHLLSGSDLPIKPVHQIKRFFADHAGTDFVDVYPCPAKELDRHFRRYHLFPDRFKSGGLASLAVRAVRAFFLRLQMLTGWRRNRDIDFRKGSQWLSLTEPTLREVMGAHDWVRQIFHHTFCPDEVFVQTICARSLRARRLISDDGWGTWHYRYIDWSGHHVHTLTQADAGRLRDSDALFARKFSSDSPEIIETVLQWLQA
ncbi:MAG: glycosyl transferase [Bacteroidales bacterium]|nr:glycosyl transferase [Bacteroidales bacterium]